VVLPAGVRPTIARNFVIANIGAPSGFISASAEAEAPGA
jgi:large subunit ribosomal protein L25